MEYGVGESLTRHHPQGPEVVLSSGPGRIHFYDAARALYQAGVNLRLVTGWVPPSVTQFAAAWVSRATGRPGLARRVAARSIAGVIPESQVHSCMLADAIAMAAERLGRLGVVPADDVRAWAWRRFGQVSVRYLRNGDVFHVRSGAGRGAIHDARSRGMKVIVDHSLVHPLWLHEAVNQDEKRLLGKSRTKAESVFQSLQLADCDDADVLLVNSDLVRRSFVAAGYPEDRIHVVHLGVHERFIGIKQCWRAAKTLRILFTGTFGVRKGAIPFLETLRLLSERGLHFEAVVVGPREDVAAIDALIPPGLPLRFIAPVAQDELTKFLRESDLYLFPTLAEGCAQSAMEALAAGLPVVTTEACGLPGSRGAPAFSLSECTGAALADAVCQLAGSESHRRELGQRGTQMVRDHYRWSDYARNLIDLYSHLVSHEPVHPGVPPT